MSTDPPPEALPDLPIESPSSSDRPLPSYPMDDDTLDGRFENPGQPRRVSLNPNETLSLVRAIPIHSVEEVIAGRGTATIPEPVKGSLLSTTPTEHPLSSGAPTRTAPGPRRCSGSEESIEMTKPAEPPPDVLPADPLPPPPPTKVSGDGTEPSRYERLQFQVRDSKIEPKPHPKRPWALIAVVIVVVVGGLIAAILALR